MRGVGRLYLLGFAGVVLTACAHWAPVQPAAAPKLQQREVLEFDFVGEKVRLHAVTFQPDSVTGVPWLSHPECDSCRVSYPLKWVRNPRVGRPEHNIWIILGPLGGAAAIALFLALTS